VYVSRLEVLFGADAEKLFFALEVDFLREAVVWMSGKGFQSWVIPAGVIVGGCVLWWLSSQIHIPYWQRPSTILKKLRLW